MERYVLIRPGALGDALLTFPTLALLRRERPRAHVTLVARGDVLPLARAAALADATSDWAAAAWAALFAVEPHSGAPSEARAAIDNAAVVAWLADAGGAVASNLAAWGARQVVIALGRPQGEAASLEHMALRLARALSPLGIAVSATAQALLSSIPPLRLSAADEDIAERLWQSLGLPPGRVVALQTGSGGAAKRWPPVRFAELARRLIAEGWHPLLIEGPADAEVTAAVLAALESREDQVPVARGLDVGPLAALLRRCIAYAGNDSGVSHLAGLAGVPTLALFGPTDPARWSPLGPRVRVLRAPTADLATLWVGAVWEELLTLLSPQPPNQASPFSRHSA